MSQSPLYQIAALAALVAASDWLGRHTWLRHLGGALLVIVMGAIAVNIGLLPKHVIGDTGPLPVTQQVYDQIFATLAQIGIFWLLLGVSLREVLCLFVGITIAIHGLVVFVPARLFGWDPVAAAVASQANIGGATSALALARALGRSDLTLPAILLGSVGLALGTFLGFSVAGMLR